MSNFSAKNYLIRKWTAGLKMLSLARFDWQIGPVMNWPSGMNGRAKYSYWQANLRVSSVWLLLAGSLCLSAQMPGTRIVEQSSQGIQAADKVIIAQAEALRSTGKLLNADAIKAISKRVPSESLILPKPSKKRLTPAEVASKARDAYLKVGWYYLCKRCDKWHLSLAGGYAISTQGAVVTCDHVVDPDDTVREGFLIAANETGEVFPVIAIIARNDLLDAAIVRVAGAKLTPLPLNDQVQPGDAAYCYSDPLSQAGYFSAGLVNRFYWKRTNRTASEDSLEALCYLRLNVSTDWAPGSSGAAVLDECGNAIGHVSTISLLARHERSAPERQPPSRDKGRPPAVTNATEKAYMVLHEAVPARGILSLAKGTNSSIFKKR